MLGVLRTVYPLASETPALNTPLWGNGNALLSSLLQLNIGICRNLECYTVIFGFYSEIPLSSSPVRSSPPLDEVRSRYAPASERYFAVKTKNNGIAFKVSASRRY